MLRGPANAIKTASAPASDTIDSLASHRCHLTYASRRGRFAQGPYRAALADYPHHPGRVTLDRAIPRAVRS